jgi:hypothetical protein
MKRKILIASSLMVALTMLPLLTIAAETETSTLTTQSARTDTLTATRGETAVSGKISSDFKTFAGSTGNADALVKGLRSGSPITLTSTNSQGTTNSTTFTAPTGKMGYGNVFISLSLARQQLANAGITQPTAQQIQASLQGGTVTTDSGQTVKLSGVAQMRSDGMGWGQIANTLGFKLGPVVSGIKSANANVAARPVLPTQPTHASTVATAAGSNSANVQSGIVSGTGASVGASGGNGQGNAHGRGIVSATGGAVGGASVVTGGAGHGNAYGQGIVTGAGSNNAGGNSAAHSKGK